MAGLQHRAGAHGVIPLDPVSVSGGDRSGGEPLFASEPLTDVSRRCAPMPTSIEVAPVVVAYLRQQGDSIIPPEIEALLPTPEPPARSREMAILVAFAVVLFIAAFAVAFALLPRALQ